MALKESDAPHLPSRPLQHFSPTTLPSSSTTRQRPPHGNSIVSATSSVGKEKVRKGRMPIRNTKTPSCKNSMARMGQTSTVSQTGRSCVVSCASIPFRTTCTPVVRQVRFFASTLPSRIHPLAQQRPDLTQAVDRTFVNLVDLVDINNMDLEVELFESEHKLSEYTISTGKFFPRKNAHAGGLLQYLLRHILNPRGDVPSHRGRRRGGRGRRP